MNNRILNNFKNDNFFFVTPDVKRGIGLEDILPNYHIICTYFDPLIPILRKQGAKIFCLNEEIGDSALFFNNSGKLLENALVKDYIRQKSEHPYILAFKPSMKIDLVCEKNGFIPLINKAELNSHFEDKINFFLLVKKYFSDFCIPGIIEVLEKLDFANLVKQFGLPFVIQFSHGWAGKTTFFIRDRSKFIELLPKFAKLKV